ncbi:hypothetical protein Y1Q_0005260 [Alligator mississippiensis]|uniref:Uncharacterized protein n=1 Tax=Alligator mississippiensis TaxID=8496 RepID=A0A151MT76_ALLMI|nr:hypothetical protein Y1Q_0005260 [Alligator mississippiensis]
MQGKEAAHLPEDADRWDEEPKPQEQRDSGELWEAVPWDTQEQSCSYTKEHRNTRNSAGGCYMPGPPPRICSITGDI